MTAAPLNVVFYAPSYDSLGGGEIWLNRVANELRRRGHSVSVIGQRRPQTPVIGEWESGIARAYLVDQPPTRAPASAPGLTTRLGRVVEHPLGRRLDRLIGGWRPPGMFQNDIPAEARVALVVALREAISRGQGAPTTVICSDVYTASHISAMVQRGEIAIEYVIVHHLSFASLSAGTFRALRDAARGAAALVALTGEDAEGFRSAGFARVSSIPNPNPQPPDPGLHPAGEPERGKVAVWLGRMTPQKSLHLAVEAWSRICGAHPDWRLMLYGDGPERAHVHARIAELGVEGSVTLAGVTDDVSMVMAGASINLLPSQFEGWGLVIGEAGLHGVPSIAFDCAPGVRAQIVDGVDGILVPLNDLDRFTAALDALMSDSGLRRDLGAAARRHALAFSATQVGDRWEMVLASAANSNARPGDSGLSSEPVHRLPVTLCVSTRNAADHLAACVASVSDWISELVVVDMESSDDTVEIAEGLGARVVKVPPSWGAEPGRQSGIDAATQPWVLVLDADERAGAGVRSELERYLDDETVDGVWLPRQNFQFGYWVEGAGIWPDWQLRFFRSDRTTWPGDQTAHTPPQTKGRTVRLPANPANAIIHHSFTSITAWMNSANRYTDREADHLLERGVRPSLLRLAAVPLLRFGEVYVRGRGYRGGRYGLSVALMSLCYWLLAELKLWERRLDANPPARGLREPASGRLSNSGRGA